MKIPPFSDLKASAKLSTARQNAIRRQAAPELAADDQRLTALLAQVRQLDITEEEIAQEIASVRAKKR